MNEPRNLLPEPPAVIQVGGSKVSSTRVTGPPSVQYPILRDLGAAAKKARIVIEFDTSTDRLVGLLTGTHGNRLNFRAALSWDPDGFNRSSWTIQLADIIAFRVLTIEIPEDAELPIML